MTANELRSKVMKTAWKNFKAKRRGVKKFATALKSAWKFWKEQIALKLVAVVKVVRETEKALLLTVSEAWWSCDCWIPKSQITFKDEKRENVIAEVSKWASEKITEAIEEKRFISKNFGK